MRFCIVGTGRCGTRLLMDMLEDHPDLFVFNETHWIGKLYECFGTDPAPLGAMLDILARTCHVTGAPTTDLDAEDFCARMDQPDMLTPAQFSDAVGRYFAEKNGKILWADKTPDYGYMTGVLQLYWPECRIIHLIRDGVRVAHSMAHHPGYKVLAGLREQYWCPLSLDFDQRRLEGLPQAGMEAYAQLWERRIKRIRNEAQRLKPGSYLEVRHEDILADPAGQLARIAAFADLPSDADWLVRAPARIDTKKTAKPRHDGVLAHFNDAQKALMRDLGYDLGAA